MRLVLGLLLALLVAVPSSADELRPGYVELSQTGPEHWRLAWKYPLADPQDRDAVIPAIPANCRFDGEPHSRFASAAILGEARLICTGSLTGQHVGAADLLAGGDVMLRYVPAGEEVQTFRLTAAQPVATIAGGATAGQVWRSYFTLGVEHILEGWDHLLFVIALVVLVRRGWAVAKAVTAFTIAHSLTLAGTTLGLVGLPARPVEAVIALSIVFLAVEIVRSRAGQASLTLRYPWVVAFIFGLVHGFGFAGALAEIGVPRGEVFAALLSFNLGVEAGQLLVVGAVLALLLAMRRLFERALEPAIRLVSYMIGITGAYWLFERTLSLA